MRKAVVTMQALLPAPTLLESLGMRLMADMPVTSMEYQQKWHNRVLWSLLEILTSASFSWHHYAHTRLPSQKKCLTLVLVGSNGVILLLIGSSLC